MIKEIQKDAINRMQKCVNIFEDNIKKIYVDRISPNLLKNIQVNSYGAIIPIYQLANIVIEDVRTLSVTVFDQKMRSLVEKAIQSSDASLSVVSTGKVIRVLFPPMTEERRNNLIKIIHIEAERSKTSVRNIRRDINTKIKMMLKNKNISENEDRKLKDDIQRITNDWIEKIDFIQSNKEIEIMKI